MKKYKYKLESILKLRKFEEYQVRVELGKINSKIDWINKCINDYKNYISEIFELQQLELKNISDASILSGHAFSLKSYRDKILDLENEREKLELESKVIREKLIKKKNKVKTFEQMKNHNYDKFLKDQTSKEENEIEEIAQNIFINLRKHVK